MALAPIRIEEFDTWREGYAGASVEVFQGGTTTPAQVYSDFALTSPVDNPIQLDTRTIDNRQFGKFPFPIYVGTAYELLIDSTDQTGIVRPAINSLVDEIASYATSATRRSNLRQRRLIDRFDDIIVAEDFGEIGNTPATNTATLQAAIGAASGQAGGVVLLPVGTVQFTTLSLSQGVVLRGHGRDATTLLSTEAGAVITLAGDRSGLEALTLDGSDLTPGSIGVDAVGVNESVFRDCLVKRFATGLRMKGGRRANWQDFSINNCQEGANLLGDANAGGGGGGDQFRDNEWRGGLVNECTIHGVQLSFEDLKAEANRLVGVGFEDNSGIALLINGARGTTLESPWFSGNTTTMTMRDDSDASQVLNNTVIGFLMRGGSMADGFLNVDDTAQDVILRDVVFSNVDWILTLPANPVILINPIEDSQVTVSGDTEKLLRRRESLGGEISGTTTDATTTPAWAYTLQPGELIYAVAKVVGNQINDVAVGVYHIAVGARRPGSTLAYDNQTANFTVGQILTGATSGAVGTIQADSDSGATGTLTLVKIVGAFENNEIITDALGGSAQANGTLTAANAALDAGGVASLRAAVETVAGWNATFVASGGDLQLQVTGAASDTVEWTASVEVVSG